MNPSLLSTAIASLALLFTIISFWWIHARRGRIISYPIIVFSGYVNKDTLRLRLPIVIHNTGAKPTVVRGLALKYSDASGHTIEMPAEGFHTSVKPGATFEDFMHAYVIPGRTVVTKYVTFKQVGTIDLLPGQPVDFELEVLRDSNTEWKKLISTPIHTGLLRSSYITMSNDPRHWQSDTAQRAMKYQQGLFNSPDPQ